MAEKLKVLFLCTANSARSQMAEGLLRHLAGGGFEVHSAGLESRGLHPMAVQAMAELGIDISDQTSKSLRVYMGHVHFNTVITVCANAEDQCPAPLWSNGEKMHWPFDDPAAIEDDATARLETFREVRDAIRERISQWLVEIGYTAERI
jgi:arsenate reductase